MGKLKLFITGGSGFIGSNIIKSYVSNGWEATTFIRDANSATFLKDIKNLTVIGGNLEEKERLYSSALGHDVIIHASDGDPKLAIDTMNVLVNASTKTAETKKSKFIFCSGCMVNGSDGKIRNENDPCDVPHEFVKWKVPYENYIVGLNGKHNNFSTAVVRPNWVYGLNTRNFTNDYLRYCKDKGRVPVSDSMKETNRMAFIHVEDNSNLFYLVGSKNVSGFFNASNNEHVTVKEFTEAIANYLNVKIVKEQIDGSFVSLCASSDQRITTVRANELGWTLKHPSILKELPKIYEDLYH